MPYVGGEAPTEAQVYQDLAEHALEECRAGKTTRLEDLARGSAAPKPVEPNPDSSETPAQHQGPLVTKGQLLYGAASAEWHKREERFTALSGRELDVLRLVHQDCTNREIGATLGICEGTVKTHIRHVMTKLGYASRVGVALWYERSLVTKALPTWERLDPAIQDEWELIASLYEARQHGQTVAEARKGNRR
jgi:DNA-binding NarL/FixJ family response regulator